MKNTAIDLPGIPPPVTAPGQCHHEKARYRYARFLCFQRRVKTCKCGLRQVRIYAQWQNVKKREVKKHDAA